MLLVTLLIPVVAVVAGFQPIGHQGIIDAKQFVLKDKNDKVQARLYVNEDGFPNLSFLDKEGKFRLEIGLSDLGAGLSIDDAADNNLVSLLANRFGATQFELAQPGGKRVSLLSAGKPDNRAQISLGNEGEGDELEMVVHAGESYIQFFGKDFGEQGDEGVAMSLGSDASGTSDITINGKKGKGQLTLKGYANGKTFIQVLDDRSKSLFKVPGP